MMMGRGNGIGKIKNLLFVNKEKQKKRAALRALAKRSIFLNFLRAGPSQ